MGKTIPVTIMNEHRDAYWHWHWIIDQGIVPHDGNYLLHIDHHDDFEDAVTGAIFSIRLKALMRQNG